MDENYKFCRKFEMGVLLDKSVDYINKNYRAKKQPLSAEADMKDPKNQSRLEVWSATDKKIGSITQESQNLLSLNPFMQFVKARTDKNAVLVKAEVARITRLRLERAKKVEEEQAAAAK